MSFLASLGGLNNGSLFGVSDAVDTEKQPGETSLDSTHKRTPFEIMIDYVSFSFFFRTLLCVWCAIALGVYYLFPYGPMMNSCTKEYYIYRLLINASVTLVYVSFWHITLYTIQWGRRPFVAREYSMTKVVHNVFYTLLAIVQWTMWECIILYCYATKKLSYVEKDSFFSILMSIIVISIGRDVHFYFSHRFLHIKPLYAFIHSLHHRNTDVEPFSGLTMHPIEHLYYFTSYWPILCFKLSAFALLYVGFHLLISPAAAHSGFEDHSGSDLFHYLHHKYFECNYGHPGIPFDLWMGTYKDKLDARTSRNSGAIDRKANLFVPFQSSEHAIYWISCVVLPFTFLGFKFIESTNAHVFVNLSAMPVALMVGLYPIVLPCVHHAWKLAGSPTRQFTMDEWLGKGWLPALILGLASSVWPVVYLVNLFLQTKSGEPIQNVNIFGVHNDYGAQSYSYDSAFFVESGDNQGGNSYIVESALSSFVKGIF